MEYVTKKIPRRVVPKLRRIQARRMLRVHRRVSEAEIFEEAIDDLEKKERQNLAKNKREKHSILNICGFYKATGKKMNATEELDNVVYGDVNKT